MRFPPSFIERLRSHFLMSEVIGRRMAIKKHGREFQGLCPFHNEKTPSFTVNDAKGFFHCFGCGAHGDAIEFVRRYDKLSYPEAIEHLARDAAIPLPQLTREETRKIEAQKTLYDALEAACQWFEKQLAGASGASAREYVEKRGLKPETLRQFRIGYAPDGRTALHQHLLKAGFPQTLQAEAGLIIVPESGAPYDRFRGRVMFPIRNSAGKVIAFGGRLMQSGSNLPKYLNSPETVLFKKGELLYNLDLAKKHARDSSMAVVMEGYMDVVSTAQSGVGCALATLGTAVTAEHLRLLWQLVKEPVMCLDGDAAGMRAMLRAADVALPLLKPGYSLRFATLPAGEDPDSFVQKFGRASFEKLLAMARRLSDVVWDKLRQEHAADSPESLAALKSDCHAWGNKILDPTVKKSYLQHFDRNCYACERALWDKVRANPKIAAAASPQVAHMATSESAVRFDGLARQLFQILHKFPSLLHKGQMDETLASLDIRDHRLEGLRNTLLDALHGDTDDLESFAAYIYAQVPPDALPPLSQPMTLEQAEQRLGKIIAACGIASAQMELEQLQHSLAREWSEEMHARKMELQEAIRKAQAECVLSPAESEQG